MLNEYNPDAPEEFSNWLGTHVNDYWNHYLEYWEIPDYIQNPEFSDDLRDHFRKLDKVGAAVRKLVHSLSPDEAAAELLRELLSNIRLKDELTPTTVAELLRGLYRLPQVRDIIAINLGFEVADVLLPKAEKRVPDLVSLIAARTLSDTALAYLDRVTKLYLWGFDPESVIMCRSTLEAALASKLYPDLDPDAPAPPLEKMLKASGESGLLDGYTTVKTKRGWTATEDTSLWKADQIRISANRLVHNLPLIERGPINSSLDAVRILKEVLDVLYPPGPT